MLGTASAETSMLSTSVERIASVQSIRCDRCTMVRDVHTIYLPPAGVLPCPRAKLSSTACVQSLACNKYVPRQKVLYSCNTSFLTPLIRKIPSCVTPIHRSECEYLYVCRYVCVCVSAS